MMQAIKNIFSKNQAPDTTFPGWFGEQSALGSTHISLCVICSELVYEKDTDKHCARCRRRRRENPLHALTQINAYTL